jgi:DNA polymerase V
VVANKLAEEAAVEDEITYEQLDLFTDYSALEEEKDRERKELEKEKNLQHAVLDIKKKFGKNAIVKGMNLEEGAMTIKRNEQIGGHKA